MYSVVGLYVGGGREAYRLASIIVWCPVVLALFKEALYAH